MKYQLDHSVPENIGDISLVHHPDQILIQSRKSITLISDQLISYHSYHKSLA